MRLPHSRPVGLGLAGALTATLLVMPGTASASTPDTSCMRAGIKTLQSAGLLDDVARSGLPIATAVALHVTPRAGTDLSAVPDPLPLSLILADHRAGSASLFVYPWCG